jgi:hypothetical protein
MQTTAHDLTPEQQELFARLILHADHYGMEVETLTELVALAPADRQALGWHLGYRLASEAVR